MRLLLKSILTVALAITLATSIIGISLTSNSASSTETVVKVEPTLIEFGNSDGDPIPIPGTQFTVTARIHNITNLYGFDLKFRWNTTYLEYVSHSVRVPRNTYLDGVLWNPIFLLADEVDRIDGTYWIACASMSPAPSFNGTGTVFTMTFEVAKQPYDYETGGPNIDSIDTILDFSSTDLAPRVQEPPVVPILHNVESAIIKIWEKRPTETVAEISVVNPLTENNNFTFYTNTTSAGSRFNATLWIYNVTNLHTFQTHINYNSTLLNATRAWLPTWNPQWVFYDKNTIGFPPTFGSNYVKTGDALTDLYSTFSGTGILSIIEFEIIYVPTTGKASCGLDINNADTFLLNPITEEISSVKTNGYYEYVYVTTRAQPIEIVPYVAAGIATAAIIVATAIYFAKIRKPK